MKWNSIRKNTAAVILMGFFVVGIFGFLAMGHSGCIMTIATQNSCMQGQGSFSDILSHLQLYKSFSTAVIAGLGMAGMLWFAMMLGRVAVGTDMRTTGFAQRGANIFGKHRVVRTVEQRLLAWLSIQERRAYDAFAMASE